MDPALVARSLQPAWLLRQVLHALTRQPSRCRAAGGSELLMGAVLTANALPELPAFVSEIAWPAAVRACLLPACLPLWSKPACVQADKGALLALLLQYYFGSILSAMGMYTLLFTATATLGLRIWAYSVGWDCLRGRVNSCAETTA